VKIIVSNDYRELLKKWVISKQPDLLITSSEQINHFLRYEKARAAPQRAVLGMKCCSLESFLQEIGKPSVLDFALALGQKGCMCEKVPSAAALFYRTSTNGLHSLLLAPTTKHNKELLELWEEVDRERYDEQVVLPYRSIHLYGFSFLEKGHMELFAALSKNIAIELYAFLPSMMLWEDLVSDREGYKLLAEYKKVDETLLLERNALLANFGTYGRSFGEMIEHKEEVYTISEKLFAKEPYKEYRYIDAVKGKEGEDTTLSRIQGDLLYLLPASGEASEHTVKVHRTPTLFREVEVLHDALVEKSGSILVLAPDIELYRPYIDQVFQESPFSYQICGSSYVAHKDSGFFVLFFLFSFAEQKRGGQALTKLFSLPQWKKKFQIDDEDAKSISEFFSISNCNKFSFGPHSLHAIKQTLFELWTSTPLEPSSGELLARVIALIEEVYEDLAPTLEENTPLFWLRLIETCRQKYLFFSNEEKEVYRKVRKNLLHVIQRGSNEPISFAHFVFLFKEELHSVSLQKEAFNTADILFSSIDTVARDVDNLCLLGMNEQVFGKKREEKQRYALLEALMAATKTVHISYQGISHIDGISLPPAAFVRELISSYHCPVISHHLVDPKKIEASERQEKTIIEHVQEEKECIDIADILKAARDPLEYFFQKQLGLVLDERRYDVAPFELLNKEHFFSLLYEGLEYDEKEYVLFLERHPYMPQGNLKKAVERELCFQHKAMREATKGFEKKTIELSASVSKVEEITPHYTIHPAIEVGGKNIVGTLRHMTNQGLCFFEGYEKQKIYKKWPEVLLAALIQKDVPELFFAKNRKKKALHFTDPHKALEQYISFLTAAEKKPIMLFPEHIDKIKKGEKVEGAQTSYYTYFAEHYGQKDIEESRKRGSKYALELFQDGVIQDG